VNDGYLAEAESLIVAIEGRDNRAMDIIRRAAARLEEMNSEAKPSASDENHAHRLLHDFAIEDAEEDQSKVWLRLAPVIARALAQARAEEREACAQEADCIEASPYPSTAWDVAAAIRARKP
jgi:hypothetical protein